MRNAPTTVNNVVTYDTVIAVTNSDYSLKARHDGERVHSRRAAHQILEIPNAALRFEPLDTATVETNASSLGAAQLASLENHNRSRHRARRPAGGARGARSPDETDRIHTLFVLAAGPSKDDPVLEAVQVMTGITDNIHTEVLSGLKQGDQVVTGLKIPGLAFTPKPRNPFGFGRRF